MIDLYAELGIERGATPDEIKKAYRKRASEVHPDKGGTNEQFQSANMAYEILINEDRRARYDSGESPESILDNSVDPAYNLLGSLFLQMIEQIDIVHQDVFASMSETIKFNQQNFIAEKSQFERKIRKFEITRKKIAKDKGNLFTGVLDQAINACKNGIKTLDNHIVVGDRALAFLRECEYSPEVRQQMLNSFTFNVNLGGSFGGSTSTTGGV
jgi:curved DNA-binding protein CbpA